jgi:predicted RecA/RadA family phage recombinase
MADATYKHPGEVIKYTPSSAVALGQVVVLGDMVLVAPAAIKANEQGELATVGVYEVAKASGTSTAIGAGVLVYWDDTNKRVTTTASGNKKMGYTVKAAVDADTTTRVMLNR